MYGSDRCFLSVIQSLVERADIEVEVVLPTTGPLVDELAAIGVVPNIIPGGVIRRKELKTNPLRFLWDTSKAAMRLRKLMGGVDVIYVNTIVYMAAYLAASTLSNKKRRWAHVHEIPPPPVCRVFLVLFRLGRFQRIYNSNQTQLAFNDSRSSVVHNGVMGPQRIELHEENSALLKILFLGRINTWKGHEFALKALEQHLPSPEEVEVTIVGDAFQGYEGLIETLRNIAENSALRTSFHSFSSDTSSYFLECDVVLVPSILPEPFGRVAIEAFSYGRPVIAANHGGLPEIVTHGETGYLFKPSSAISLAGCVKKFMEMDVAERRLMSMNARKRYEKYFSEAGYMAAMRGLLLGENMFDDGPL